MSRRLIPRRARANWTVALVGLLALRTGSEAQTRQPVGGAPNPSGVAALAARFENPPDDARIMMRWWWFGPSVTKQQLEREMRLMKEGGIGGFEIQPVYPLALNDKTTGIKNLPFLSDEFIDAVRFTSEKANDLGLRLDLTLGSGWPFGGPMVSIADAAARLRVERVKPLAGVLRIPLPPLTENEKLINVFMNSAGGPPIELADVRDGAVHLVTPAVASQEILFFISSRTGMMVKRPAIGAEGFVLNHYDQGATLRYLHNVGDRLMQAFGPRPPHAIFCDSLESYGHDWTEDFLPEFEKRRGYDLRPHLPALVLDLPESKAIRGDWGRTLTELLNERFMAPLKEWSAKNRTLFRIQGYGLPPATISSNALADLSEGEGVQWKSVRASRWASSASHLFGQPVTSAEAWTWLHSPVFRATPLDMKAEADVHFLQGINQLIGHGWPYTSEGIEYPGWRFYAASVFNEKNPWWTVMPDVSGYLQRMSFILREGEPRNDVALYLPNDDAWSSFSTGGNVHLIQVLNDRLGPDVMARILESGFNLDFVDDEALQRLGRVENGALTLGKNRYRAVVLPGVETIPLGTYRKLEELQRSGGAVIATRRTPERAPGFRAAESQHREVREISDRLFRGSAATGRFAADENKDLPALLTSLVRPDLTLTPSVPEIGFVHRATTDADIYFIANTSNTRRTVKGTFRVDRRHAESWDAMSGRVTAIPVQPSPGGGMRAALDLEAYASRVIVFSAGTPTKPPSARSVALPAPLDWSNGFKVAFGASGSPAEMTPLRSWTDEETTRYFSGVAAYEKTVTVPANLLRRDLSLRLDFGEARALPIDPRGRMQAWIDPPVREAAVVFVNGQRAGSVWAPPYSLDITSFLKPGENKLRIEVANLALNFMAGHALPDYKLLNLRYGVRFEAQDMDKIQPIPSGLLGGVHLAPAARESGH